MKFANICCAVIVFIFISIECEAYKPQTITITNTVSQVLTDVPATFGLVFESGSIPKYQPLQARSSSGELFPLQVDRKATYPDGSLRHAIISLFIPGIGGNESKDIFIELANSDPPNIYLDPNQANDSIPDFIVSLKFENGEYFATLENSMKNVSMQWLSGAFATEWITSTPFVDIKNLEPHPHLSARFNIRKYSKTSNVKIDFVLENCTTWSPELKNYEYAITITNNGSSIYSNKLTHFARSRWKKTFWTQGEPPIHIKHDPVAMIKTRAIPAYDPILIGNSSIALEKQLVDYVKFQESDMVTLQYRDGSGYVSVDKYGPMGTADLSRDMGSVGGRDEIGPLPRWTANYIVSQDMRAKYATIRQSDLSGSWPIHYRDENTGLPVSICDHPNLTIHFNSKISDRPTPTIKPDSSPYAPDIAHQPSFNFVPYIITGDYFHLEEMQFWISYSLLTLPSGGKEQDESRFSWRGQDMGIFVLFDQVRSRAWLLRTLAQSVAFTPDDIPQKRCYEQILKNNIKHLPKLMDKNDYGFVTLRMRGSDQVGEQTWMDDFLTWATGYAEGLGFSSLKNFNLWKTRFSVQRMGYGYEGNIYCWQLSAPYKLPATPAMEGEESRPFFDNINQIYLSAFPDHSKYACGSNEFLNSTGFRSNKQLGNDATCSYCYGAILGIALTAAVDSGTKDAQLAWNKYMEREPKPDYIGYPNWAIVPVGTYLSDNSPALLPAPRNLRVISDEN